MFRVILAALPALCLAAYLLPGEENSLSPAGRGSAALANTADLSMGGIDPVPDDGGRPAVRYTLPDFRAEPGEPVVDPVFQQAEAELTHNRDPERREQALYLLRDYASEPAQQLIEAALADPQASVRAAAIDVLAEKGDARSASALIHAYYSESEDLREEIVHALADGNGAAAAQLLLAATQDASLEVRTAALAYTATD